MINRTRLILITVFLLTVFSSCHAPKPDNEEILSVSIEPQRYFLETIVGDRYKVNSVIPSGSNPETFDPSPSQMVALNKSRTYFKVGHLSFENVWIENVKRNNPALSIVDCSQGITVLEGSCEGHSHDHEGADPHIWSSPQAALVMAENMYKAIVKIDPDHENLYRKNFDGLVSELARTDSIIRKYIEKTSGKSFLIYHPALTYFSHQYGLNQLSIEHEGKTPSPMQLKEMIDKAEQNGVKIVFIQKEYDKGNAETIAKEIGAKVVTIDLLSYNWSEQLIRIARVLALEDE